MNGYGVFGIRTDQIRRLGYQGNYSTYRLVETLLVLARDRVSCDGIYVDVRHSHHVDAANAYQVACTLTLGFDRYLFELLLSVEIVAFRKFQQYAARHSEFLR